MKILVVDVGGTHVKVLATGRTLKRSLDSGPLLTPRAMVAGVKRLVADWDYDAVSLGVPAPVVRGRIIAEPANLGKGWMNYDFSELFGCPVKVVNDAAMQALGSFRSGRLLFLGIGTGLGSALVLHGEVEPLELAHLPYRKGAHVRGLRRATRGSQRLEQGRSARHVFTVVRASCAQAILAEDLVLGGGNARFLNRLPPGARLGGNAYAFKGGFALWKEEPRATP